MYPREPSTTEEPGQTDVVGRTAVSQEGRWVSVTLRGDGGLQVCQGTDTQPPCARADERGQAGPSEGAVSFVVSLPQGYFHQEFSQVCWADSRLRAGCALHAWQAQRNTDIRLLT